MKIGYVLANALYVRNRYNLVELYYLLQPWFPLLETSNQQR